MEREVAARMLGVSVGAAREVILKAFRAKAMELHPDLRPTSGPEPDMAELVRARETLLRARVPWLDD